MNLNLRGLAQRRTKYSTVKNAVSTKTQNFIFLLKNTFDNSIVWNQERNKDLLKGKNSNYYFLHNTGQYLSIRVNRYMDVGNRVLVKNALLSKKRIDHSIFMQCTCKITFLGYFKDFSCISYREIINHIYCLNYHRVLKFTLKKIEKNYAFSIKRT